MRCIAWQVTHDGAMHRVMDRFKAVLSARILPYILRSTVRLNIHYLGIKSATFISIFDIIILSFICILSSFFLTSISLPLPPLLQPMHSSFFTSLFTLLLLATFSAARIVGIAAPASAKAGKKFTLVFRTEDYIQNFSDEYVIVGARQGTPSCDTCLGTPLIYTNLHGKIHENTGYGNLSESITIASAGSYTVTAAITSVFGVG
ncbi:hypothetical protein FRB93_002840 [Tulasnella sp. JGI-2019a]|nr:hypothetical protein FRB93_002840 [Tulasnella sp. JGI-2019a]